MLHLNSQSAAVTRSPAFLRSKVYNSNATCEEPRSVGSVIELDTCLPYGETSRLFTCPNRTMCVERTFSEGTCSPYFATGNTTVTSALGVCEPYYLVAGLSAVWTLEASVPSDLTYPALDLYAVGDEDCSGTAGLVSEFGLCSPHRVRYVCTADGTVKQCTYSSPDCREGTETGPCESTPYVPDTCTASAGGYASKVKCAAG